MLSILIPAYNESEHIGATITALRTLPAVDEIVVVDDGSKDNTAWCAEKAGATLVIRQANAGKGAALRVALSASEGDVLLLLDADLGETAVQAERLLRPILTNEADMTIATFPIIPGKGGGVGLVVRTARKGIYRLTGHTMQAPLSGQRALRRELLHAVGGFAEGWGVEIALTVGALRAGYRVLEVPTEMTHRVTGRSASAIRHRAVQYLAALRVLSRLRRDRSLITGAVPMPPQEQNAP